MTKRVALIGAVAVLLLLAAFVYKNQNTPTVQAAAATCGTSTPAQNGITVIPSHGQAFYVDTGYSPKLDAGYAGYRVVNRTGSTKSNLWVQVSSFTGSVISLANPDDSMMQLSSVANNSTSTAYFLLKANGATTSAQTHTVTVYDGRPDVSGSTQLYTCVYTFTQVKETISANSNSVSSVTSSTSTLALGQNVVITVQGSTGNIGNGSSPDNDLIWLTPAAVSSWPTSALRLQSVSASFTKNPNTYTFTDQLMISGANSICTGNGCSYTATYTFRVIGRPNSTVQAVPSAAIASGTQTKHTSISPVSLNFTSFSVNASLTKTITATTSLATTTIGGIQYVGVPYQMKATTTNSSTLVIDEIVDTPGNGTLFKSGSSTISDIGRSNVALSDPVQLSSESGQSPRPYHFVGPFTISSTTPAILNYTMWVPVGTYSNIGYAKIGDLIIGATASAMSQIDVTSTGTTSVSAVTTTASIPVVAITQPATNASSTTATLNGTIDPYGSSPLTAVFLYSTNSSLIGAITATATTPSSGDIGGISVPTNVSVGLTGLSINTTYYYKVQAGSASGDILSFTTSAVQASPTVTVQAASNLNLTSATLNGTINPNLTSITAIQFLYSTSSTLSSGVTTLTLDDGAGTTLTAGGSSVQPFSTTTPSSLTGGLTYYYKIRACTASSGTWPNVSCSSFIDSSITSFLASGAPTAATTAATSVGSSVATLNGTIKANFATTTVSFSYSTSSTLSTGVTTVSAGAATGSASTTLSSSISGLAAATTYYFRISGTNSIGTTTGSILSFTTSAVNRTLTIDASSYTSTYSFATSTPTITSTASAGGGTKSYTSWTTDVCTVNSSSGVVTFVSVGTCTISASIAASTPYTDASSASVSFTITAASRTLTIDGSSYTSTYSYTAGAPTITATPSVGSGTITYSSTTTGVCTIDGSTGVVTFVDLGTCTIGASISASGGYGSADASTISFSVTSASRTLTIDSSSYISSYSTDQTPPTITATPSAGGGTITFTSNTTGVCTINSSTGLVAFVSAGTCTIGASIAANGGYASANASTVSFTLINANRTLTIESSSYVASYAMTGPAPTLTATSSAGGGTLSFYSNTPSVCTVNSGSGAVTFVSAGTCTVYATIGADSSYSEAVSPTVSFSITLASRTLTIDGSSYNPSYSFTASAPTLTATSSAGSGSIVFTGTTTSVCTVNSGTGAVTFVSAGSCGAYAVISPDGTYGTATSSAISFMVTPSSRTLAIDNGSHGSSYTLDQDAPVLTATPSAGSGSITFTSSTTDVCTVNASSGLVTFVGAGTCTIGSSISANGGYSLATSSTVSMALSLASRTLTIDGSSYGSSYNLNSGPPTLSSTPSAGTGAITYASNSTDVCTVDASSGAVTLVGTGTCSIGASIAANGIYNSANASNIAFTVAAAQSIVRRSGIYGCTDSRAINFNLSASYEDGSCMYREERTPSGNPAPGPSNLPSQSKAPEAKGNDKPTVPEPSKDKQVTPPVVPSAPQASPTCAPYLTTYIKLGAKNDSADVKRLQSFLNSHEGERLAVDGVYKKVDSDAVKRFQTKYNEILKYWNLNYPTGYVYTATQNVVNKLYCEQPVPAQTVTTAPVCPYFVSYQKEGDRGPEVVKIKLFLNTYQNAGLELTPFYDSNLTAAVKKFQGAYVSQVLAPWGISAPTGWWYQSTKKAANEIMGCKESVKLDNGKVLQ